MVMHRPVNSDVRPQHASRAASSGVGLLIALMSKLLLVGLLVFTGCGVISPPAPVKIATPERMRRDLPTVPLSQIDLSKIGAVAPKGRVQDRDYNNLLV